MNKEPIEPKIPQESEPVILVEGTEADLEEFFALEQKLAGPTYRPETRKEDIFGPNKFFYLAKVGGKTIGQIAYERQEENTIYLNTLAVNPDSKGKGYGKELMRQFMEKVKGAPKIWLVTHPDNTAAIHIYESFGFKITETKENYFGNGTPRVVMVLEKS